MPDDIFCTRVNRIDRDYAGFLDGSFDLMPNLTLSAGIRYFKTRNSLAGFSGFASTVDDPAACPPSTDPNLPCLLFDKTTREDGETHKVNLTWKARPDAMVYFTYSTGFRPGGINRRVGRQSLQLRHARQFRGRLQDAVVRPQAHPERRGLLRELEGPAIWPQLGRLGRRDQHLQCRHRAHQRH